MAIFEDFLIPGQKGLFVFTFEIHETKQLDLRRVLGFFDIARIRQAGRLKDLFGSVSFLFKGFDADPRATARFTKFLKFVLTSESFTKSFPTGFLCGSPLVRGSQNSCGAY